MSNSKSQRQKEAERLAVIYADSKLRFEWRKCVLLPVVKILSHRWLDLFEWVVANENILVEAAKLTFTYVLQDHMRMPDPNKAADWVTSIMSEMDLDQV